MRLPSPPSFRHSALLCSLAVALSGCASLGSLMPGKSTSADAAPAVASSGVQTTKQRRFLGIFSPYRVDIQQGNFVSREMVAQVRETMKSKEGMTPDQVRFVMGTPLVTDVFHNDRWDYVFRLERANGEVITSDVQVYFENNRLKRLEGGDLPTEKDYIALIAGGPAPKPAPAASAPAAKADAPAAK